MYLETIILVIAFFGNLISSQCVKNIAENNLKNPYNALPDIIHRNIKPIPFYYPDRFMYFLILLTIIQLPFLIKTISIVFLKKLVLCVGLCLILRAITMNLTIFPSCIPKERINKKLCLYDTVFLSSHDFMFSGHTILYIFFSHLLNNNLIQIIGPFLSIASRQHYTIDVFVSFVVFYLIYQNL